MLSWSTEQTYNLFDTPENSYRNMRNIWKCLRKWSSILYACPQTFKEIKVGYEDPENDPPTAQNLDITAKAHELVSKQLSNDLQIDGGSTAH